MLDASRDDLTIGIVGAGAMGRGIAQIAALAGIRVLLADARREAVSEALGFVARMIDRQAEKGRISAGQAEAAKGLLVETSAGPEDGYGVFAEAHVVVEAVLECMDIKHAVLKALEAAVSDDCILVTNTSSLSVTAFAAAAQKKDRVAGFHFFNPVPLMKIVEVIPGLETAPEVVDSLKAVATRMGHFPAEARDTPGFLVNHAGRGYTTEALRLLSEQVATIEQTDRIMHEAAGFPLGPFSLLDLTALDVSHPVMESIYHQYYEEARYRPDVRTARMLEAGHLGRKVGRGFYRYENGKQVWPEEVAVPTPEGDAPAVWISSRHEEAAELRSALGAAGVALDGREAPAEGSLILVTPWGEDATTAALAEGLDPTRTLAVDLLLGLDKRLTLMTTPATEQRYADWGWALLARLGQPVALIADSTGFVAQRILATVVNIACDMCQQGISAPETLDKAVCLGLGYPKGPLSWGDELGARRVLQILVAMLYQTGDPRYRPSPWLRRRARLGLSLLQA